MWVWYFKFGYSVKHRYECHAMKWGPGDFIPNSWPPNTCHWMVPGTVDPNDD